MDMGLKNKTALVTGSTKGIGKAIAIELAREGVNVLVNGRKHEEVERTVNELKSEFPDTSPQNAAADLVDLQQREALLKKYPHIDILVNNMGTLTMKYGKNTSERMSLPRTDYLNFICLKC